MGGFWWKHLHAGLGVAAAGRGGARGSSGKAKGSDRQLPGIPDSAALLRRWSPGGPLSLPRGWPQSHSHRVRPGPYAA